MKTEFFLGANSRYGFRSLYDNFCPGEEGCFLHVIKGGPGCGKSSFMRRIGAAAEKEGLNVEYILCSGDPDSLDGVYIPSLRTGYVDGTAPHVLDAVYPGCRAMYLDLGRFYDSDALRGEAENIMEIHKRYKAHYSAAYAAIAAGAASLPRCLPGITDKSDLEKLKKKAESFARREFIGKGANTPVRQRFAEAFSCKGQIFLAHSVSAICSRICLLDNDLGLGHIFLRQLLPHAQERGLELTVCPDCLDPELISAIILPQLSLALVCSGQGREGMELYRHMHLDNLVFGRHPVQLKPRMRRLKRISRDCLAHASNILDSAKAAHDELEAVYNPHVDFDGVYEEAQKHISRLFGPQISG